MTRRSVALALGLTTFVIAAPCEAQGPGPMWEKVGDLIDADGLLLLPGPTGDTLVVADGETGTTSLGPCTGICGTLRFAPGDTTWSEGFLPRGSYRPEGFYRSATGTVFGYARAGPTFVDRRDGQTYEWTRLRSDDQSLRPSVMYERRDGSLVAGTEEPDFLGSTDGGRTWEVIGQPPPATDSVGGLPSRVAALAEARLPTGAVRLAAAVTNGLTYSDDGGRTWTRSVVWATYEWRNGRLAAVEGAGADTLYATIRDASRPGSPVFASADGGATWEERHRFSSDEAIELVAAPDGTLFAETSRAGSGPLLWLSRDGARTWEPFDDGYAPEPGRECVLDLEVDSAGRLVLAGCSGVWRTSAPVYAVSSEPAALEAAPLALEVFPNPTDGRATVVLEVASPQAVRVAVYDVLGREVAVVWDGPASSGQRIEVETAGWPVGTYTVRAEAGDGRATARLTVVR